MIIRHVLCYAEAILVVFGLDKRKIANREFRKAKIHQNGIIDVDDFLCLGYTEELIACSRGERRAIDRFIKRGGDPFAELEKEGEHLWNDLIPSFKYFSRRHASASAPDFDDESFLYKELPKRRLLERMGVTKEDAKGTPYEYLFDDVIDLGAILTL